MAVILLVTHGTAGDVLPFVRIGSALAARGHDVSLLTHAPYAEQVCSAGLAFVPIDTESAYRDSQARSRDLLDVRSPADLRRYYDERGLFRQLRDEVASLTARHRPGRTVLVGRHTSALSVLIAGEALGAPTVSIAVAPIQLLVAPVAALHLARGLADGIDAVRAEHGLLPRNDWLRWLGSADRTLGLWTRWFDEAGTRAPGGVDLVGFVTGDDSDEQLPPEVATLLAAERAPILVTGGTGAMLHPRFYAVALDAITATGRDAVVVAPDRTMLPERLPPGTHWHPRLPFPRLIPEVGALLHHGGIGTAVRALRSGTPQVIMAHGADRPDNAERLASHRLGRWLDAARWSAEAVAGQLAEALADHDYAERADEVTRQDPASGSESAADLIEATLTGPNRQPSTSVRDLSAEQRRLLLRRLRR
ncbi:glycosyltransferase [Cryptosporangium minutisporangium]|uniref:Glycosyltransferase n=1 Tax=Cryptosporangium minutisporangium TaxID=113569 RepID=A0ABP6SZN0_9ACTN